MASPGGETEELGFDAVIVRLREVVEKLETGNLSLEESLTVYEQGVALARRGHGLLDGASRRVDLLVTGANGVVPVPFDASTPAGASSPGGTGDVGGGA